MFRIESVRVEVAAARVLGRMVVEIGTIVVMILPLFVVPIIANSIVAVRIRRIFFFVCSLSIAGLDAEERIASLGSVDSDGGCRERKIVFVLVFVFVFYS